MLLYLLEKEFKQFFRNSFLPRFAIMFPVVAILVFPLAANFEIKNIGIAIVDHDRSEYSRRLAQKILSSGYFTASIDARSHGDTRSYDDAIALVERGKADIVLEIPGGFSRDLARDGLARVMISANTVNGTRGGLGSSYLSLIIADFNGSLLREQGKLPSRGVMRGVIAESGSAALSFSPLYRYNPLMKYTVYMVPAIMVMLLAMVSGFLPALNIVSEKEKGTIEQMNVTPVRRGAFILAKLIPYWAIGFVSLTLAFVIAALAYSLVSSGGYALVYLFASVFVLAMSGFGLVISNYAKTLQQAMFMMFFFIITFVLISGLYTPLNGMPAWARALSYASPLRYMIESLRMIFLKGSGFWELKWRFLALACFALTFNGWAVLSYRKQE
jgi:ABC-2 type transport system permease protein